MEEKKRIVIRRKLKNGALRHYCPICGAALFDEVEIGVEPFKLFGKVVKKVNFEKIKDYEMATIKEMRMRDYICSEHLKEDKE